MLLARRSNIRDLLTCDICGCYRFIDRIFYALACGFWLFLIFARNLDDYLSPLYGSKAHRFLGNGEMVRAFRASCGLLMIVSTLLLLKLVWPEKKIQYEISVREDGVIILSLKDTGVAASTVCLVSQSSGWDIAEDDGSFPRSADSRSAVSNWGWSPDYIIALVANNSFENAYRVTIPVKMRMRGVSEPAARKYPVIGTSYAGLVSPHGYVRCTATKNAVAECIQFLDIHVSRNECLFFFPKRGDFVNG